MRLLHGAAVSLFWVTRDLVAEYRFGLCQYVRPYGVCKCESEQKSLRSVRGCLILPKPFKLEAKRAA